MKLSIVIPVFNEARSIEGVLRRVAAVPLAKEILVVDDASRDGTTELLERIAREPHLVVPPDSTHRTELRIVHQPANRGKGAALHRGFAEATGEIVVVQDADFEYDPSELPALVAPVARGEADVVFGSRFLRGHRGFPFWHTLANRLLTAASNAVTGFALTDMETCYKVFRAEIVKELPLREERFGFEPEVTALLAHRHRREPLRLLELPISYRPRTAGEGKKIGLKDAFRAVYCITRYGLVRPAEPAALPAPEL